MKIKYKEKTDTFTIKGVTEAQLEVIMELVNNVTMGKENLYQYAAFEILVALENTDLPGCCEATLIVHPDYSEIRLSEH
jgi:hypothetical protein